MHYKENKTNLVIYDGACGFCKGSVNLLIKLDKKRALKYASLQGKYASNLNIDKTIDSIVYYENQKLYYKSTAILKILNALGGVWRLSKIFYIIPKFIRDFIYDLIAKNRYIISKNSVQCKIPTQEEKRLFLD